MGPRFFKRGEFAETVRRKWPSKCFNGATLLQAWRDCEDADPLAYRGGFNGATLLQAWRGAGSRWKPASWRNASMGPRFFKRGETAILT